MKRTRKDKEKTPEQTQAMFERMAKMRIQLNENRKHRRDFKEQNGNDLLATRIITKNPIYIEKPTHNQEGIILFEKQYNSKIEKLDEAMSSINNTLREMNERKREKYLKKDLLIQSQEQAKAEQKQAEQKQAEQKQAEHKQAEAPNKQAHITQIQAHNKQAEAQTQAPNKQAYTTQAQLPNPNRYLKQPNGKSRYTL